MCVPVYWLCDGKADCPLASDEAGCSCEDWGLVECTGSDNSTQCVPEYWVIHGHPLCPKLMGNDTIHDKGAVDVSGDIVYLFSEAALYIDIIHFIF